MCWPHAATTGTSSSEANFRTTCVKELYSRLGGRAAMPFDGIDVQKGRIEKLRVGLAQTIPVGEQWIRMDQIDLQSIKT